MTKGTLYGAYNARWKSPEEVAESFVPLPPFSRLVRESHSVLMGPRGCGKTTLLKMLTRRALKVWASSGRASKLLESFRLPNYEAIYIPSDTRWSYEIRDIADLLFFTLPSREQTQRVMIVLSIIQQIVDLLDLLISDSHIDDRGKSKVEVSICEQLSHLWNMPNVIPSLRDMAYGIESMMINIRGIINAKDPARLTDYLLSLPPVFYAHSLDAPIITCKTVSDMLPDDVRPNKWALCFDELEIAPQWLQDELISALRSVEQSFLLKLTWTPILPQAMSTPEPDADYTVIRLWNSHLKDPMQFCNQLTSYFLEDRFPNVKITPDEFLGHSIFAAEEERSIREYSSSSPVYRAMKSLAKWDESFRELLLARGLSPSNPVPSSDPALCEKQRDEFFRKAKPIALLRQAFLSESGALRTRKSTPLYAGREAVFAVSEGNPRWLLGLLNDLCDAVDWTTFPDGTDFQVPLRKQAEVINSASRRFMALIKATPVAVSANKDGATYGTSLFDTIDSLARVFSDVIYGEKFPLDPIGSFRLSEQPRPDVDAVIRRALITGALVPIGRSQMDVPTSIVNERFRLSFLICPAYKLPLRNYRDVTIVGTGLIERKSKGIRRRGHNLTLPGMEDA